MPALHASILVIGDEILGGYVADTNSGWLAQRLTALGIPLDRVVTLPDTLGDIQDALVTELDRSRPRVILTSGGIGSTPDDLTMLGVARTLNQDLVAQPDFDARISRALEWTASRGVHITEAHERAMRKMALVPADAYLLEGATGMAPGVAVDVDGGAAEANGGATVVILPGVPGELKRIVTTSVEPRLLEGRGEPLHVEELTHPYPESTLTPLLERIAAELPGVHLGSYPGRECLIRLKGHPEEVAQARALIDAELAELDQDAGAQQVSAAWQERWTD